MPKYTLDKEKYKAAIMYIAKELGGISGKKKAYKLLYFLDFDNYEAYEKPFTGETYVALPMGPAPRYFDAITSELEDEGYLEISEVETPNQYHNDIVIYTPIKDYEYEFDAEGLKMLDRITAVYGEQTGKSLEELSHSQAPYLAVGMYEVVPYEFSLYRGTPGLSDD